MKEWKLILERLVVGRTALACALAGTVALVFMLLQPLPWHHFPNILKMFRDSWLYLIIAHSLIYTAITSVVRTRTFPGWALACVIIGTIWKLWPALLFVPFNVSRILILYGLAGLVADCIRRVRPTPPASTPELTTFI